METNLERRHFLKQLPGALSLAAIPFVRVDGSAGDGTRANEPVCWLNVCAPFILEDENLGIRSEIILTSDTFVGKNGFKDGRDRTEYELLLYSADGERVGKDGVAKRITVPAMNTTVVPVKELIGNRKSFFGGLTIKLRPATRTPMHASDLFSSAFVRWTSSGSFDNVHANPDPLQWQDPKSFFYSMPFPPIDEYDSVYAIFNPYPKTSFGELTLYDPFGRRTKREKFEIAPYESQIFDVRRAGFSKSIFESSFADNNVEIDHGAKGLIGGGTIAILNDEKSVKNFGYLMMRRRGTQRISVEHPIHQDPPNPLPSKAPFDQNGNFRAKNVLYTPLLFNAKKFGDITLSSRFHLSSGAPIEEHLWMSPFIVDGGGKVPWQIAGATGLPKSVASRQHRSAIRLGGQQACIIDAEELDLSRNFSGGLALPISPLANHTLMKAEVRVAEWNAYAFTHFRPGLRAARAYRKPAQREALATDYITSGARVERKGSDVLRDEIVCILNIDDTGIAGLPSLEIFGNNGLLAKVELGEIPGFACRHFLLSQLVGDKIDGKELSLRLVDDEAVMLMSVVHVDHIRKDIALDHGSDRFSTFADFDCSMEGKRK